MYYINNYNLYMILTKISSYRVYIPGKYKQQRDESYITYLETI